MAAEQRSRGNRFGTERRGQTLENKIEPLNPTYLKTYASSIKVSQLLFNGLLTIKTYCFND